MKIIQSFSLALLLIIATSCPARWALAQPPMVPSVSPPTKKPAWAPVTWEAMPIAPVPGIQNAECSANDACKTLSGLCCPTLDGVFLQCCLGEPAETTAPTSSAVPSVAPTITAEPTITPAPTVGPTISAAPSFSEAPFMGDVLDDMKTCEANPGCAALNLKGTCCPPAIGTYFRLDCCENIVAGEQTSSTSDYIQFMEGGGGASGAAWNFSFLPLVASGFFLCAIMMLVH